MVVFSVLRATSVASRCFSSPLTHRAITASTKSTPLTVCIRNMGGHGRKMEIKHSTYEWNQFKNDLHFFSLLGLIPVGLIILGSNLFGGKYELADIPEDYEPQSWEYYKHPITRFMVKHWFGGPEKNYELCLHVIDLEHRKREANKLERKIKQLISDRNDYKAWYYMPVNTEKVYKARKEYDDRLETEGYSAP